MSTNQNYEDLGFSSMSPVAMSPMNKIANLIMENDPSLKSERSSLEGDPTTLADEPDFEQRLESLMLELANDSDLDITKIEQALAQLQFEVEELKQRLNSTDYIEQLLAIPIDEKKSLGDLSFDEMKAVSENQKIAGNNQQATELEVLLSNIEKMIEDRNYCLEKYKSRVDAYQHLNDCYEWKQVENNYIEVMPELKPFISEVSQYLVEKYQADPLVPFTNKYLLVKEAIERLGLAKKLNPLSDEEQNSLSVPSLPDSQIVNKKITSSAFGDKKKYQMDSLKQLDYRKLSDSDLKDIQQAMFEGRIE